MYALPDIADNARPVGWPTLRQQCGPVKPERPAYPARLAVLSDRERHSPAQRAADADGLGRSLFAAPDYPAPPDGGDT